MLSLHSEMKLDGRISNILTKPAVLVGMLLVSAFSHVNAQVNAEQVMAIGRNVMSMEDYVLAIQYFNQAIKAKPYLSEPYYYRGLAKLNLDDFIGAEQDCSLAIERNKFKKEAFRVRGFSRLRLGKDSLAVSDCDEVLVDNPYDTDVMYFKSIGELNLKHLDSADSVIAAMLKIKPDFSEAWNVKANLELERNDTVAALASLQKALDISAMDYFPYLRMADIYDKQKNWDAAVDAMDHAIKLMPAESDFYINRGYLRYRNDDYMGAMADYNYALELKPDNYNAMYNRALLRFEVRELDKALDDFSAIIKYDPTNYHAVFNRALVYLNKKQYRKAIEDIQAILKRFPKFYSGYNALAQCYMELGQLDNAAQCFTDVLNSAPDNFYARYNREQIYLKQKKYSKALVDINAILKEYPKFYPAYYDLAQCRYAQGDEKGAVAAMNQADELVRDYVANPKKNPLDRPTIAFESNNNPLADMEIKRYGADAETESEMMEKFNQLITTAPEAHTEVSFKERIRGKVQNTETYAGIEPNYTLSVFPPPESLKSESSFFKELSEVNDAGLITERIYLTTESQISENSDMINRLFDAEERYSRSIADGNRRPVDYLARSIVYSLLKNYEAALTDVDMALEEAPDFIVALLLKANIHSQLALNERKASDSENQGIHDGGSLNMTVALNTLDRILRANPRLVPAWFNKGNLYYQVDAVSDALACYNRVLELDADCGPALFNRALIYMRLGERDKAFNDFSKAGQLGVLQAYSVMKQIR